jgi:hypothetical protein
MAAPMARPAKKASSSTWVVLVHTSGDVPASWSPALQDAAHAAADGRRFVPPPSATLDELQLALGCDGWNAACAGLVADTAGAGAAVVVDVAASADGIVVDARIVGSDGVVGATTERLTLSGTSDIDRKAAEAWVAGLVRGARPAVLLLTSDLPGDEVLLDDVLVGRTPLTLVGVTAGEHKVQVRRAGRAPLLRTISVVAGQTTRENVVLSAVGPPTLTAPTLGTAPTPAPSSPPTESSSSVAWGLTGAGTLLALVGGVFAVTHGVPVIEASMNQTSTGMRLEYEKFPVGGTVSGDARFAYLAERFGTTEAVVRKPEDFAVVLGQATLIANVAWGLLAVGGAVAGTGLGLLVVGGEDSEASTTTTDARAAGSGSPSAPAGAARTDAPPTTDAPTKTP